MPGKLPSETLVVSRHDFKPLQYNVFVLFESYVTIIPLVIITRDVTSVNVKKDRRKDRCKKNPIRCLESPPSRLSDLKLNVEHDAQICLPQSHRKCLNFELLGHF